MQTAGQYRLQVALSSCQVGDVWSGTDERGRPVTVAVLNERASVDDRWRDAFAAAAEALGQAGADQLPIVGADHQGARPWVACAAERGAGAAQIFEALGQHLQPVAPTPAAQPGPVHPAPVPVPSTAAPATPPGADDWAPTQALPVQPGPHQPLAGESAPTEALPVLSAPTQAMPAVAAPAVPVQPTPAEPVQPEPPTTPMVVQQTPPALRPGEPVPVQPVSGHPYPSTVESRPTSGLPVSGQPTSGFPGAGHGSSGFPVSGSPVSGSPVSGYPVSGYPMSGYPTSGLPVSGGAGYPPYPAPTFGEQPPAKRRRTGLLVTLVAIAGLLAGSGAVVAVQALRGGGGGGGVPGPVSPTAPARYSPADLLLPEAAPAAPGAEPPRSGGWPSKWPTFTAAESTKPMNGLDGVGFDFRVPPTWTCTKAEQRAAAVHYRCGDGAGDSMTSGGDLVVRTCEPVCDEQKRTALRQREEAWGVRWTRSGPFTAWAYATSVDGKPVYGLMYVAFWRSTPEGQIDRELVLRLTAPLAAKDELKKVANSVRDQTFTL
ncbi:hypothetical protein ACFO0M_02955 [Micromonospora mangrovi]|uniref:Uncharacterized protein n=2 Tax=Micromonospora TaxID=1873 RepID=A0AAU8H5P5_9ACTN